MNSTDKTTCIIFCTFFICVATCIIYLRYMNYVSDLVAFKNGYEQVQQPNGNNIWKKIK